jgi:hypothetical protein
MVLHRIFERGEYLEKKSGLVATALSPINEIIACSTMRIGDM